MKRMKWLISIVAIVMAVTLCFAGCKQSTPEATPTSTDADVEATEAPVDEAPASQLSTDPVEIQFWNGWTGSDGDLLRELVNFYNDNNKDGVTVVMDIMEHAALTEKMAAALVSDTAPALHLNAPNGEYAVNGQLVPLDDVFELTDLSSDDFVPAILEQMYFGGHLMGLPFQLSSRYLYWNKDLFAAAGLDPETPPSTWDELYEFSKTITDPDKNIYGGGPYFNDAIAYPGMILSYGGKIINGESIDTFSSALLDPEYYDGNLAATKLMEKLVDEGCIPTFSGSDEMFFAGNLGMHITGAWLIGGCKTAENLNWGISLLPAGPEGKVQLGMPVAMVVMKGTEGRELEAAFQFMNYWNNNINNSLYETGNAPAAQWCKTLGYQPYLYSVANDEEFLSDPIVKVTNSYVDYLQAFYPTSYYKFFPLLSNVITPIMENVAYDAMSPEDALVDGDNLLKEQIASYKE